MADMSTQHDGTPRGVVAVGASAGGVEALIRFAAGLPADLPFAVVVVLHLPPNAPSVLAPIIDRSGPLPATTAVDDAKLEAGHIYVAAPDRHLLVFDHRIVLSEGPTENRYRPAINALFRSVALAAGPHAIGVLMSGVLDDGVLGMAAIRARGGTTLAQSADDALFPAMPLNAVQAGLVDHQVTAADAGALLAKLGEREIADPDIEPDPGMELENTIALGPRVFTEFDSEVLGPPSGYTCPDCNGSLLAVGEKNFRCRVGHAWSAESLLAARDDEVDGALWVALRSLHEKAKLSRRLAEDSGSSPMGNRYHELADEAEHAISVLDRRLTAADHDSGQPGDQ
jgi:two-component system, chemotaxis family, protein-glutamate methylesterase/glutaminase